MAKTEQQNTVIQNEAIKNSIDEVQYLPATRRLDGLAQVDPMINNLFNLPEWTRGLHTKDAMVYTFLFLRDIANKQPDFFEPYLRDYGFENINEFIFHAIEVVRLHDICTLPFQGALHGKIKFNGKEYDENTALLAILEEESEYSAISSIIFDNKTEDYYRKYGLSREKIKRLVKDIMQKEANGILSQIFKNPAGIDWIVYTARDYSMLERVFSTSDEAKEKSVKSWLYAVSDLLSRYQNPTSLKSQTLELPPIEKLVPINLIRLQKRNNGYELVYDAESLYDLYYKHFVLRIFLSGSPWIRGYSRLVIEVLQRKFNDENQLIEYLLSRTENEILSNLNFQTNRELAMGWYYAERGSEEQVERIKLRDIASVLLEKSASQGRKDLSRLFALAQRINSKLFYLCRRNKNN